jgi:hypothetical protein
MARYDYGLRGPRETVGARFPAPVRGEPVDRSGRSPRRPPENRVTARYNRDYLRERGPMYTRNPHPYGGDWAGRIGGEEVYRRPYLTRGGTWTHRGGGRPPGYDRPDYGPDYGGRYPDEL